MKALSALHLAGEPSTLLTELATVVCDILESACYVVASPGLPGQPLLEVLSWGSGCQLLGILSLGLTSLSEPRVTSRQR